MNRIPFEKRAGIEEPYMTLAQIADIMGISREAVRQIEQTALRKMRKRLIAMGIEPEHFINTLKYNRPVKKDEILSDSSEPCDRSLINEEVWRMIAKHNLEAIKEYYK